MAFWGVEVKPGEPYIHQPSPGHRLRITQATLGSRDDVGWCMLECKIGDAGPVRLCALNHATAMYRLDLEYEEKENVVLSVLGNSPIHLSGYYIFLHNADHVHYSEKKPTGKATSPIPMNREYQGSHNNDGKDYDFVGNAILCGGEDNGGDNIPITAASSKKRKCKTSSIEPTINDQGNDMDRLNEQRKSKQLMDSSAMDVEPSQAEITKKDNVIHIVDQEKNAEAEEQQHDSADQVTRISVEGAAYQHVVEGHNEAGNCETVHAREAPSQAIEKLHMGIIDAKMASNDASLKKPITNEDDGDAQLPIPPDFSEKRAAKKKKCKTLSTEQVLNDEQNVTEHVKEIKTTDSSTTDIAPSQAENTQKDNVVHIGDQEKNAGAVEHASADQVTRISVEGADASPKKPIASEDDGDAQLPIPPDFSEKRAAKKKKCKTLSTEQVLNDEKDVTEHVKETKTMDSSTMDIAPSQAEITQKDNVVHIIDQEKNAEAEEQHDSADQVTRISVEGAANQHGVEGHNEEGGNCETLRAREAPSQAIEKLHMGITDAQMASNDASPKRPISKKRAAMKKKCKTLSTEQVLNDEKNVMEHLKETKTMESSSLHTAPPQAHEIAQGHSAAGSVCQKKIALGTEGQNDCTDQMIGQTDPRITISDEAFLDAGGVPVHKETLGNGLIKEDLEIGDPNGEIASDGKKVYVKYVGMLKDGKVVDPTTTNNSNVHNFKLGAGRVIVGWDLGIQGMRVGGKRRLTIPPALGFGDEGLEEKGVPAKSWLIYEIELLKVKQSKKRSRSSSAKRSKKASQASVN